MFAMKVFAKSLVNQTLNRHSNRLLLISMKRREELMSSIDKLNRVYLTAEWTFITYQHQISMVNLLEKECILKDSHNMKKRKSNHQECLNNNRDNNSSSNSSSNRCPKLADGIPTEARQVLILWMISFRVHHSLSAMALKSDTEIFKDKAVDSEIHLILSQC